MRKPFLLSLLVALLTSLSTHAYDFQSGDLYYNITSSNTVEVTYQESWSESNYQGLTTATIPATVTNNGTTYSVTSIGDGAFMRCSSLTSITIPNSVTSIGGSAFYGCSSLTSITIGNSVTSIESGAFESCSSLTSVIWNAKNCAGWSSISAPFCASLAKITSFTFGEEVETIPSYLCYGMSFLTSITIPNSVTSIGGGAFSDCSSLTSVTLGNSVTSIGTYAFYNCSSLTSITLPNSVTSIGNGAFNYCSSLTSIILPNSVTSIGDYAFAGCSSLTSIILPNSVTSIGERAFLGCFSLTSITIPNSVTSIGDNAFYYVPIVVYNGSATGSPWGARSVNGYVEGYLVYADETKTTLLACSAAATGEITLPNSVTSIGDDAFFGCSALTSITLPNSVTSIGDNAFEDCSSITSITIPNSVKSIGDWAFSDCTSLTSITLSNSVTSIGSYAFSGCSSLTSITLPNSVTTIAGSAFRYCSSLTSITLPNSVTSIGSSAFKSCSSLTSITLPNSVTSIGSGAFTGCSSLTSITLPNSITSIEYETFSGCSSLTSITIPNSVTSIRIGAFSDCSSLTSITLPNSITSIEYETFSGCSSLTSITIGNSVTSIGNYAFDGCSSLTSIILPNSVTSIGNSAFYDCSSLTSVTSLSCTPPSCGSQVFTTSEKTLVVPSISMDAYKKRSTWKDFTSFEKCLSVFVQSSDSTLGVAQIDQEVDCDSVAIISAVGNLSYAFTQWSDGNTDNPRTIKLTQDTTFTAEFGLAYSGKCGDDLYWAYSNKEVKITGTGAMYNYTDSTMPWTLLRDSILTVRVGNNATSIGAYAFANTPKLAKLHIGTNVEDIGANAFAGCKRLYDIYCYPTYPPFAESNSFANYNVYVYVPCENQRDYTLDVVWGEFKFIECIGSENVVVSGNEVTVSPDYEDATFTWPVTDNADTYSLVITKDGVTFCTLVFNAQGQLVSIAFKPRRQNAPAAEGTTPATYAEMTANGFRFTVTGLNEGSAYAYTLTVRNAANTVLETYTGDFTTLSNTPTSINESAGEDAHAAGQVEKIIRNGQVLILRNGETYDMMGQRL